MPRWPKALLAGLLILAAPAAVHAQAQWLAPKLGENMPRADYTYTFYPDQRVHNQGVDFGLEEHRFSLAVPVFQNTVDELSVQASVKYQDVATKAVLPDLGVPFPDQLWDVKGSVTYRHRFENGWIGGGEVSLSSPSDRPFDSWEELMYRVTLFLRVPHRERNAFFFLLTYANHQELVSDVNVPIPGIGYLYSPSDRLNILIGMPFTSIQWKPIDTLSLDFSYVMLREIHARATYQVFRPLRVYVGFDWDNFSYLRAGRGDEQDRFFYYEKRAYAGVRFDLRYVGFEVRGGWAFDRFYFEGEGYGDRTENRVIIGDGPFVMGRVAVRF
ncbi:MAG: hypothetical protein ABW020_02285 [Candidatus Rokuibacteriota bacterium]